jgi:hypothetical protein
MWNPFRNLKWWKRKPSEDCVLCILDSIKPGTKPHEGPCPWPPLPANPPAKVADDGLLIVDLQKLQACMAYLAEIEQHSLERIIWVGADKPAEPEQVRAWKYTGLNNRDFGLMMLTKPTPAEVRNWISTNSPGA